MKLLLGAITAITVLSGAANAADFRKGETFQVLDGEWVAVARSSNEDRCIIQEGGLLVWLGHSDEFGELVEYRFAGNTSGTPCDHGTLFWAPADMLTALRDAPKILQMRRDREDREKQEIQRLLDSSQ